jgi:hypothetical protein
MNVFGGVRFFPVPQELFEAGTIQHMSRSAILLYTFLLYLAQKHSAVRIETVGYEIRDYTGMHENSATTARRELVKLGLVKCKALQRNICEYHLLDPKTRQALLPPTGKDGKQRVGLRRWHPVPGRSAKTSKAVRSRKQEPPKAVDLYPPSWDEINATSQKEPGEDLIQ